MRNEVIEYKCPRCRSNDFKDWGAEANYDLNVYDLASQEDIAEGWLIVAYKIPACGNADYSDDVSRIHILPEEAKVLTFGVSTEDGGDYTYDEDFVIDKAGFLETYKNIPARVQEWLDALPVYETPTTH